MFAIMDRAAVFEVLRRYDAALRENGAMGLFIFRIAGSRCPTTRQ
jgi:hypothetical protein